MGPVISFQNSNLEIRILEEAQNMKNLHLKPWSLKY